jgi:hypothetical protein
MARERGRVVRTGRPTPTRWVENGEWRHVRDVVQAEAGVDQH